jgi:hypothetical protein
MLRDVNLTIIYYKLIKQLVMLIILLQRLWSLQVNWLRKKKPKVWLNKPKTRLLLIKILLHQQPLPLTPLKTWAALSVKVLDSKKLLSLPNTSETSTLTLLPSLKVSCLNNGTGETFKASTSPDQLEIKKLVVHVMQWLLLKPLNQS